MESSNDQNLNGSHLGGEDNNGTYDTFLNGINRFADSADLQSGNDNDFTDQFFDPALFESTNTSFPPGYGQQQSSYQSTYDQHVPRQSASPAVPTYGAQQGQYPHGQYPSSMYDPRNVSQSQPGFDPRYTQQRPSHSPAPMESYQYPQSLYSPQQFYNPQQVNAQPQSTTPTPSYPPRTQLPQYLGYGSQPGQPSQARAPDIMQFQAYHEPQRASTHRFVDPSMLSPGQVPGLNGSHPGYPTHASYLQQYYSKSGFTIDPRSLQSGQSQQAAQLPNNHQKIQPAPQSQPTQQSMQGVLRPEPITKVKGPKDPHVPKKPKTKTSKDGVKVKADGTASDSGSSSDELSIEDEPPEAMPAVLQVAPPTDERGKALYFAVQAVWSPRNKPASADKVRSGIAQFGDTVRALRDAWKAKADKLKAAELPNAKTADEIPALKMEVAHYRQVMEGVVTRSLQYAHPSIIKRLGENHFTMAALHSFLLDRFNASDYDSLLVMDILKFVVNFETIDDEQLERTKWAKILPRFAKKSTTETKTVAQTILTNASAATAKKRADGKAELTNISTPTGAAGSIGSMGTVTGMKRIREGDAIPAPAPKKTLVRPSSKPLALQNEERRRAQEAAATAQKAEKRGLLATGANGTPATASAAAGTVNKTKSTVTAPPKSAVFSALMSASKKPGTSIAARAAAGKDNPAPKIMVEIPAAKKELVSIKKEPAPVPRKEPAKKSSPPRALPPVASAKGSSSFLGFLADMEQKEEIKPKKEDEALNETEEQKQKRVRKEARRRLRVAWKPDTELVETRLFTHDPEEDQGHADNQMRDAGDTGKEGEMLKLHKGMDDLDDEDEEEIIDDYSMPLEVDLSDVKEDIVENSTRYGGPMKPESASRDAQDEFEENTIMVVYDSETDRPTSPKEPPDDNDDADFQPCVDFGEPIAQTREREKACIARSAALQSATFGIRSYDGASQPFTPTPVSQQQTPGMIANDLQRALSMLTQQAAPVPQPAPAGGVDLQKILATVQQFQQQQQQPQYQQPPVPVAASTTNNLSALLAQMQQQQPAPSLPLSAGGIQTLYATEDQSRKHARNDSGNDLQSDPGRDAGSNKKKKSSGPKFDEGQALPYNYKTQTCSFWKQNKCLKGDACTYRHDDAP